MEEKTFAQWWKENEDELLEHFPHWTDIEVIKKLCLNCWQTQNANCEIKIASLEDDYENTSFDNYDEDDEFFDER